MKQSLQLRLGQQITMTPQLQQAIRLLQLSTLDLQLEIQQTLESNIMLEVDEEVDDNDNENLATDHDDSIGEDLIAKAEVAENGSSDETASDTLSDIPEELAVDTNWEDIYDIGPGQSDHSNSEINGKDKDLVNQGSSVETLRDHLMWQLGLTPFNDLDRAIATAIIDAIDDDGYLRSSLEDIVQSLGDNIRVDLGEIETVLHRIQHFDPTGIGARNISECLLLQLAEVKSNVPWIKEAQDLVSNHLDLLAIHDYLQLTKLTGLSRDNLRKVVELIQSLNPRPGSQVESHQSTYIIPDVFVKKVKGQWKVELNGEVTPKLRINNYYASLISRSDNRTDVSSLKNHLQEARWFIKSLRSRHETLLKVAKCIVKRQAAFLEYGAEAMKPLVLHDIASELDMHESTISRVTTQKYLHTARGIFELKYFFSSHVNTDSGGECSSTAIRALIKKLIAVENANKPLSDSKIAKLLSERGIQVARRTIAKYREAMAIPPSNERKRLT